MPKKSDKPRFIFHGNAMPFGGRMVSIGGKPFLDTIPGPPSGSLTVVGGWTRAASKGSSYRDLFSWGATLANSKGELRADGHFITTVTSSIADVRAKNDPFPFEAARLSIPLDSVEVEASAQFPDVGLAATDIRYRARVSSPAAASTITDLLRQTDAVAEVHNTIRAGVPVALVTD